MKISNFKSLILNRKRYLLLLLLVLMGAVLRFYNLNWGAPFYFHPDERNIASAISQLVFPTQLNPHFFAYGSFPLYAAFIIGLSRDMLATCPGLLSCRVPFETAIITLRVISSLFSLLIIPLTFLTAEKIKKGTGIIAATLSTFSIGYIQFAHFGTVEMWLTFFTLLLFYCLLGIIEKKRLLPTIAVGFVVGILISTKITSLAILILPPLAYLLSIGRAVSLRKISITGLHLFLVFLLAAGIFLLTNPFILLDFTSFQSSMKYESGVALGTLPVFYTGEFSSAVPVLFQLTAIYPFLINPLVTIVFLVALITIIKTTRKEKKYLLLLTFFFLLFLSQAFLYAKWTRYMVPTLPFIYLIISLWLSSVKRYKTAVLSIVLLVSVIWSISYFMTAFVEQDTRIEAAKFAAKSVPNNAMVLSEVYDLGIIPFNQYLNNITLFNMYELDNKSPDSTPQSLQKQLADSSYIILPSQRILKTRLMNAKQFPIGHQFYSQIYKETGRYKKIYETPCSIFCEITYLGDPIFRFEQTASVFDRPVVLLYKKTGE